MLVREEEGAEVVVGGSRTMREQRSLPPVVAGCGTVTHLPGQALEAAVAEAAAGRPDTGDHASSPQAASDSQPYTAAGVNRLPSAPRENQAWWAAHSLTCLGLHQRCNPCIKVTVRAHTDNPDSDYSVF